MSTDQTVTVDRRDSVLAALHDRAARDGASAALVARGDGVSETMTTAAMVADVQRVAAGLVAAGVQPGDRVAIFGHACPEWVLVDFAIWQAGAVSVTIYETSSPDQVAWILSNSGVVLAIAENDELAARVEGVRSDAPTVTKVLTMGDGLDELRELGRDVPLDVLTERAAAVEQDEPATLVYTSGTTGRPKGCVLTHRNLIWTIRQAEAVMPELVGSGNRTLSFLPLAHVLARVVQHIAIVAGVPVAFGGGIRTLQGDLAAVRPTWLVVVPRVLEKVHDGAIQRAGTGVKGRIFARAADVARRVGAHHAGGTTPPVWLRAAHRVGDLLVYRSIRAAMGGELRYVISGGAPLNADLALFFRGVGIEVLEGYGLTETTGPATVHRPGHSKPGTVGPPLGDVAIRIVDDGEVQLRGELVFDRYWERPEATAEAFDDDWFRTGDLGHVDDDGHLVITGRMKDLIVTAGGKNVAPKVLEMAVESHPLVSHAVIVGDDRPFIAALLTLDVQMLAAWADDHGRQVSAAGQLVEELADDPDLLAELQGAVDAANRTMSRAEQIRQFRVLPNDFSVASGELTPTMKVRRASVLSQHDAIVERIYAEH